MKLPLIGFGTWRLYGKECESAVKSALDIGYRHIDTADVYQNHHEIGQAIKAYPRTDLFITTKLFVNDLTPERVRESVPRFLNELNTDYIDLLLIHWPNESVDLDSTLTAMKDQKGVKNMGVSNFVRKHLPTLKKYPILTNQIELHPYLQRRELVQAYKNAGIGITAYRPLAKGAFEKDETLIEIGKRHNKTASQIALKWIVDQNIAVIPKAASQKHLKENWEIFDIELSREETKQIDALDRGARFCAPEGLTVLQD